MTIRLDEKIPDKKASFDLFLTTGWNEKYRLDADELFLSVR